MRKPSRRQKFGAQGPYSRLLLANMRADGTTNVRKCDHCQRNAPILRVPTHNLTTITSPWLFAQWGIDIVGPLPTTPTQKKLLLITTKYFSKWVEAEAFSSIKDKDVVQFVWKNIICQFGIPQSIVTNNRPQFDSRVYKNFSNELKVKNLYSTPWYPQSNGQAKSSNKTLLTTLKKRLHSTKGKWINELPRVMWAYRTTSRKPTRVSPFPLTHGMEDIIPTEIGMPTLRTEIPEEANTKAVTKDLDMTYELHEAIAVCIVSYHQRLTNMYNRRVKAGTF